MALTLRNLPPELDRLIHERAEKEGTSLSRAVVELLREGTGLSKEGAAISQVHHDLDRFIGSWSAEEAAEFDATLAEQRRIDPEAWE